MKAAEYIEEYHKFRAQGDDPAKACGGIVIGFMGEVGEIMRTRRARKAGAVIAIFKEQETKWKAFYRRLPADVRDQIRLDGFAAAARHGFPDMVPYFISFGVLKVED